MSRLPPGDSCGDQERDYGEDLEECESHSDAKSPKGRAVGENGTHIHAVHALRV